MSKLKLLLTASLISKILIVASIYYTVFKTSLLVGTVALLAHVTYELFEVFIAIEVHKQSQDAIQQSYDKFILGSGGGHC